MVCIRAEAEQGRGRWRLVAKSEVTGPAAERVAGGCAGKAAAEGQWGGVLVRLPDEVGHSRKLIKLCEGPLDLMVTDGRGWESTAYKKSLFWGDTETFPMLPLTPTPRQREWWS